MSEPVTDTKSHQGTLHSELAKLCLPQTMADDTRKLAYANSICLLFLIIGLIGFNTPKAAHPQYESQADLVPVIFTPPEDSPPPETPKPSEEPEASDAPSEMPQVATVVAPSSANVAFAVPVTGPVVVASSGQFVSAPASTTGRKASGTGIREFSADGEAGGQFPYPPYPREELQSRHEGKIMLEAVVGADGTFQSLTVKDSSGFFALDRHAQNWVKRNWHFLPGEERHYLIPILFQIK